MHWPYQTFYFFLSVGPNLSCEIFLYVFLTYITSIKHFMNVRNTFLIFHQHWKKLATNSVSRMFFVGQDLNEYEIRFRIKPCPRDVSTDIPMGQKVSFINGTTKQEVEEEKP